MQDIEVDVFITQIKKSFATYDYNQTNKTIICTHIDYNCPSNNTYGKILNTLNHQDDFNNLEVIIINPEQLDSHLIPGTFISCKFLGILEMHDNRTEKIHSKLLTCPSNTIDINSFVLTNIDDINPNFIYNITKTELAKYTNINEYDILGQERACDMYITSIEIPVD